MGVIVLCHLAWEGGFQKETLGVAPRNLGNVTRHHVGQTDSHPGVEGQPSPPLAARSTSLLHPPLTDRNVFLSVICLPFSLLLFSMPLVFF